MLPSNHSFRGNALERLVADLRDEATVLRLHYDERAAAMIEGIVARYTAALAEAASETLTLAQAAEESGYSISRLRAMIAAGELRSVGTKGKPLVLRGDLPINRKRTRRVAPAAASPPASQAATRADGILARIGSRR